MKGSDIFTGRIVPVYAHYSTSQAGKSRTFKLPVKNQRIRVLGCSKQHGQNEGGSIMQQKEYVNARELEARLGIPRNTLYHIAKHGDFPRGIKIGRARRWLASDIEAYLAAQSQHEQDLVEFTRQLLNCERSN